METTKNVAALCGHFVALKHRMLRFLGVYVTERKFTERKFTEKAMKAMNMAALSGHFETQDVEVLGVHTSLRGSSHLTERKCMGRRP